jgi:hypothetical protein
MTVPIGAVCRALTSGSARRIVGRCALAAIGAGLGAISISAFGADLATGSPRSITGPSQVTRAEHRPITAPPTGPTETKMDYLAAHSRMVDGRPALRGADALDASLRTGFDRCFNGGQMLSAAIRS